MESREFGFWSAMRDVQHVHNSMANYVLSLKRRRITLSSLRERKRRKPSSRASPHQDPRLQTFPRLLSAFPGHEPRTVARWVGDTEEVILQTYSHLVPDEKDQIGRLLDESSGD